MTANHVLSFSALLQLVTHILVANSQIYAQNLVSVDVGKVRTSESVAVYWINPGDMNGDEKDEKDEDNAAAWKEKTTVRLFGWTELKPAHREKLASAAKFLILGQHLRLKEVQSISPDAQLKFTRLLLHSPKETSGRLEFKVSAILYMAVPTAPILIASNRVDETWELSNDGILQMRKTDTKWGCISF